MANNLKWDTKGSTYYWIITLDPNYQQDGKYINSVNVLTGYSKVESQHETTDKVHLLKRKIITLYTNGYLKRAIKIQFFKNTGVYIDKNLDPNFLTIYPNKYDIASHNHDAVYKQFGTFLDTFYDKISKNESLDNVLPVYKKAKTHDDFTNPNNYDFKGIGQLYAHASRLSLNGHPAGVVEHFIREYKIKKGW